MTSPETVPLSRQVTDVFSAYPEPARSGLIRLRALIYEVAGANSKIGVVTETLKWGQPSYQATSGTPIRLGIPKVGGYAVFAHCQTSVISDFRNIVGDKFTYDGNRAVVFSTTDDPRLDEVALLFNRALTYRL